MNGVHITKLSDTEFHFDYDYDDEKKSQNILGLKELSYEGKKYQVLDVTETFGVSGYHSFLVYVKPV